MPFQMVMFTLSQTADRLYLNTPWDIWVIYLGFGAGLAVFMFCGFVKSIPVEVEEAALIDGCNPIQTFFKIDVHMLGSTMISVGILEAMWVWNDYLLPTLVLDGTYDGKHYVDNYTDCNCIFSRSKIHYKGCNVRSRERITGAGLKKAE